MLSFAAEFPVDHDRSAIEFLSTIETWILGSPHTSFTAEDFDCVRNSGSFNRNKPGEQFEGLVLNTSERSAAGIRYSKYDEEIEWITTAVFSRGTHDSWVNVRTSREYDKPAVNLPEAKKPRLVRDLLTSLGGGQDGALRVIDTPHHLEATEIELAASLVEGTAGCHLPIVYVSSNFAGRGYNIDFNALASDLSGMAHVVVEPDRHFSLRLQIEVKSKNVYGGAIGIYWPESAARRSLFFSDNSHTPKELKHSIIEEIRGALLNRRPLSDCTWFSLQEQASRLAYEKLKASGSNDLEMYIAAFDSEVVAINEKIADAEREISQLKAELRRREERHPVGTAIALSIGNEQNFFRGEIRDVILTALEDSKRATLENSRRSHVIGSILSSNEIIGVGRDKRTELKAILRDYKEMNGVTQNSLERLGFSISGDGKHYKLIYHDDPRYTFVLPKSGSDRRGGLNAASDISKMLFSD